MLKVAGIQPKTAESNYVANQMRLQAMEYGPNEINIAVTGSSLTARLDAQELTDEGVSLNLGLDGSNAIFSANELIDSGKIPNVLIIELNTIYRETDKNDRVLAEGMQSGTHKLAKYFTLVRAQSRPVTIIYSKSKSFKDSKLNTSLEAIDYLNIKPQNSYIAKGNNGNHEPCPELENLIIKAQEKDIRVVLLIIPDGINKPFKYGSLVEEMISKHEVEILDMKTPFSDKMTYTDGLHLSEPSAQFITEVIANALGE